MQLVRRRKKILIVEDNEDCRFLLALMVKRMGYDVLEAETGQSALEQVRATRPDLILMDLGLPDITGDETIARLKAEPATRDIPVVVHTAYHHGVQTARALAAGAAIILHKPVEVGNLARVIDAIISPDPAVKPGLHPHVSPSHRSPV